MRKGVRETHEELNHDEPDLVPIPDSPPGEDLSPSEESEDPRARSRRREVATEEALGEAPHAQMPPQLQVVEVGNLPDTAPRH